MVALQDGIQLAGAIARLTDAGVIRPQTPYAVDQAQPASLDLRWRRAYRVRAASFRARPDRHGPAGGTELP